MKPKISKSKLRKLLREMPYTDAYGLGVGTPNNMNAVEMSGGKGAPKLGWSEIDQIKEKATKEIMSVLKNYVTTTGDAYEILTVIVKELEDKMADEGYVQNGDELERFMPLQERRKRPKSVNAKRRGGVRGSNLKVVTGND